MGLLMDKPCRTNVSNASKWHLRFHSFRPQPPPCGPLRRFVYIYGVISLIYQ
nr:MAG TPA: hypothetical protein [Caudoviricetes sp.]